MKQLKYNARLKIGQQVYITGPHPWSDCAGMFLGTKYFADLDRIGGRVLLQDEQIEVTVWHPRQLRALRPILDAHDIAVVEKYKLPEAL